MIQVQFRKCEGILRSGELLTTNSVGVQIGFHFSEEWEGLTKLCVFRIGGREVDLLLEGDSCKIPPELLRQPDLRLLLGVRGTDGTGELVLASSFVSLGVVLEGANPEGEPAQSYTPALADQILACAGQALSAASRAEQAQQSAQSSAETAEAAADRLLLSRYEALLEAALVWDRQSGNPALLRDAAAGIPLRKLQLDTGFLSGGREQLTVSRTGKNLWNSARFLEASGWTETEDGGYTGKSSKLRARFQDSQGGMFGSNLGWDKPISISFEAETEHESGNRLSVYITYTDGTSATTSGSVNGTARSRYTLSSIPGKTIRSVFLSYGSDSVLRLYHFQVEFGEAPTDYEPYARQDLTFALPQTVYGGCLDLLEGSFTPCYDAEGESLAQAPLALESAPPSLPLGDSVFFAEAGVFLVEYCQNASLLHRRI
jgi:hypothetical protein